jgi:hypothetical protein
MLLLTGWRFISRGSTASATGRNDLQEERRVKQRKEVAREPFLERNITQKLYVQYVLY